MVLKDNAIGWITLVDSHGRRYLKETEKAFYSVSIEFSLEMFSVVL